MQEEPKPTPKPKKKMISKRVLWIVLATLLIALSILFILYLVVFKDNKKNTEVKKIDCGQISRDIQAVYIQRKNDEALVKLNDNLNNCTNLSSNTQDNSENVYDKIHTVEFYHALAVINFSKGEKDKAKEYAIKGLELYGNLQSTDRAQIKQVNRVFIDMTRIKDSSYNEVR